MKMRPLNALGVTEIVEAIRTGRTCAVDVMEACLARIAQREPEVGAWQHLDGDWALAQARACDAGPPRGPLHGVPLGIKDIIDTVDMPTTYGSSIYRDWQPASDAACVALVRRAGAIVIGKTVATEFAYFAPGKTANPANLDHTPGGSSSGSAAAVADLMVPAAFGTQTAASITRPAAFCGVVGYKPTFGTFSLAGIKPLAESFDTLGTLTRCVADTRLLHAVLSAAAVGPPARMPSPPLRIGICRTPWWSDAEPATQQAMESAVAALAHAGAFLDDVTLPRWFDELVEFHQSIMAYEAARNYAYEYDAHRRALSVQFAELIEIGNATPRAYYREACATAHRARTDIARVFGSWDLLLTPSAKGEAPRGLSATGDPLFSRMWTLLRVPSLALPTGRGPMGLPVGVQVIGAADDDERLLMLAQWVEQQLEATR